MTDHFERDRLHHEAVAHEYDKIVVKPRVVGNDLLFSRFSRYVRPGARMLDAACGTGHMLLRFADRFDQAVALDHSDAMLAQAKCKAQARGWTHVSFKCQDIRGYIESAEPSTFDLVTCVGFLHHLLPMDVSGTVVGLARLLRPGGVLLISEPVKIQAESVPARVEDWNRRSLAAKSRYSCHVDDPDEEPLDLELLLQAFASTGLALALVHRSFEVFPHNDPPTLKDRLAIWALNRWHGKAGNVLTLAAKHA